MEGVPDHDASCGIESDWNSGWVWIASVKSAADEKKLLCPGEILATRCITSPKVPLESFHLLRSSAVPGAPGLR